MKLFFILFSFSIGQLVYAMGASPVFPGNPLSPNENQYLNDMEETTAALNQFAPDRGHLNQQQMEEKEINKNKKIKKEKKTKVIPEEMPLPSRKMNINYE